MKKILCVVAIICSVSSVNCMHSLGDAFGYCLAIARDVTRQLCPIGYVDIPLAIADTSLVIESNYNKECICEFAKTIGRCLGVPIQWNILTNELTPGVRPIISQLFCE